VIGDSKTGLCCNVKPGLELSIGNR